MGPRAKKVRQAKTKESPSATVAEQENVAKSDEEITETNGSSEQVTNTAVDHGEDQPPLKKGRSRQKKPATLKEDDEEVNGQETASEMAVPTKKARGRKKKAVDEDEPEVMPKRKDRSAKIEEKVEAPTEESELAEEEEDQKPEKGKREKKTAVKKANKKKKDEDVKDEDSDEKAEDEASKDIDGGGDAKVKKVSVRGKAAAKASEDPPAKKKPNPRGKKGPTAKSEESTPLDDDVEIEGKRLRVNVEHCKS